jgi:hypothetical protein
MIELLKKYWDIISGAITGALLALIARFELTKIQLCYSIIILVLVCIGIFKIIKQAVEKHRKREPRKQNIIDGMVDGQKPVKAIRVAQEPIKDGEKIGELLLKLWEVTKRNMNKLKTFFDKFKGWILTIALAILTVVEMCGGFINTWLGGALTVNGIELLPVITLACTAVVGIISNGYTKEQKEKIKALFSKSTTNELVKEEIKKTIKEKSAQLTQFSKILTTKKHELDNLNTELETLTNTHEAKQEMFNMAVQLATAEDVQLAANAVVDCQAKIADKQKEIEDTQKSIDNLNTQINALKSQL